MKTHRLVIVLCAGTLMAAGSAHAEDAYGITGAVAGTSLIRFDTSAPGAHSTIGALSGIVSGHSVRAIDFRPATGELYALSTGTGNAAQLYTVDLLTAALSPVGAGFTLGGNASTRVSMDFNPTVDRVRIVTGSGQSYRAHPGTGALVLQDSNLAYDAGDPQAGAPSFIAGVAYTANFVGGGPTTLYGWDYNTDSLVTIGGIGGSPSPNGGLMFTVNTPAGFLTTSAGIGMDISRTGIAYLQHDDPVTGTTEMLDTINLSTGALTNLGNFSVDMLDISIVPAPSSLGLAGVFGLVAMRRRRA